MGRGRLLSANCTTGWLDWSAGQLWLLEDGLLRLQVPKASRRGRRGAQSTAGQPVARRDVVTGPRDLRVNPGEPEFRDFAAHEPERLASEHERALWLTAGDTKAARIHQGAIQNSLRLKMKSGRRVKLLWMRRDQADDVIREALSSWSVEL